MRLYRRGAKDLGDCNHFARATRNPAAVIAPTISDSNWRHGHDACSPVRVLFASRVIGNPSSYAWIWWLKGDVTVSDRLLSEWIKWAKAKTEALNPLGAGAAEMFQVISRITHWS
jgi:hypothetical protein